MHRSSVSQHQDTVLPTFVIIGAMRSGTTALARALGQHPDVYIARQKEVHFFDENFERGVDWYNRHFAGTGHFRARGEATPLYLFDERVPARMASVLPDAKLIAILRDPVERAYSHYWQKRSYGTEPLDFADAISAEAERISRGTGQEWRRYSYVARGYYLTQLLRFCEHFPREALLVCLFEEMRDNPSRTLERISTFIGVDPDRAPPHTPDRKVNSYRHYRSRRLRALSRRLPVFVRRAIGRANASPDSYPAMSPTVRSQLEELFREENRALADWSGLDLSPWVR